VEQGRGVVEKGICNLRNRGRVLPSVVQGRDYPLFFTFFNLFNWFGGHIDVGRVKMLELQGLCSVVKTLDCFLS